MATFKVGDKVTHPNFSGYGVIQAMPMEEFYSVVWYVNGKEHGMSEYVLDHTLRKYTVLSGRWK